MLGVVPCGGKADRWGGMVKELVPIGHGRWLIDQSLEAMRVAGVDRYCIVTSRAKIHTLVEHFRKEKYRDYDLFYVIQRQQKDLWEAMTESFPFADDVNVFAMPDTVFHPEAFRNLLRAGPPPPFALGVFDTETPERFGVLVDGHFVDKPQGLPPGRYPAWGTLVWRREVVEEWRRTKPADYTEAINCGVRAFGLHSFPLHYYHDFASWDFYRRWVEHALPREEDPFASDARP